MSEAGAMRVSHAFVPTQALPAQSLGALGVKRRVLMQAIRVALTGGWQGLPVATLLWVIGPLAALSRVDRALARATTMAS
jgi:hypothetical protein